MKIHTPIFILGLLTFVTPFAGFPSFLESVIVAAYGLAIMILVSTIKKGQSTEMDPQSDVETDPTYEEIREEVQEQLEEVDSDIDEVESEDVEEQPEESNTESEDEEDKRSE